jgi:DNA-binding LytR/AlgR family response regulator
MNRPRAVIAEDEALLRGEIRETLVSLWQELEICAEAADGFEALRALEQLAPQILFLDIQMPGLSGLEVAQHASRRAHVVFITAYNQHALAAFEQGALDYVLKPITAARLAQTVTRLKERLSAAPADLNDLVARLRAALSDAEGYLQWISILHSGELRLITVNEICYFRASDKYVAVVTAEAEYLISTPIKSLCEQLDPKVFWRIHRGVIVNINAIRSLHRDLRGSLSVRLKQRPETLQVSATFAHLFKHM